MKKFGKILVILLLLVVVASCFVACSDSFKHTTCGHCGKRINYAGFKSGRDVTCPHCGAGVHLP